MRPRSRQAAGLRERRRGDLEDVEAASQVQQELRVETGADLAGEDEVGSVLVADEQSAKADARPLRVGEPSDNELLRRLALHLQPVLRAAMLVGRTAPFRDHPFPTLTPGEVPRCLMI